MRVEIKDAGPCRKTVKVEVPAERVAAEYARVLDHYTKEAQLPGFRQGKAPRNVVERRFGKQVLEDVKEHLIPESCRQAIEQEKLDVVAVLGVKDVSFGAGLPLAFSMELDVPPDFKLPKYKGLDLEGHKVEVSDQDVSEALDELRAQYASFEEVKDRGIRKGDVVQIDYEGVCEGKPVDELAPEAGVVAKGKGFWFRADDGAFLPGLVDQLLGETVGAKKQVFVDFNEQSGPPQLAGKKATYFVDVKAIREERLPELNKDFLDRLKVDSEEALRARVREDLQEVGRQREKERMKGEIIRELLQKVTFDLPESLVRQETRSAIYEIVQSHTARGVSQKDIEGRKDQIYEAAVRGATDRVKLRYILHRIADEEKLQVSDEELASQIELMSARYGMEPARMRAELEERQAVDDVREDLRARKTLDFLLEQAKVRT
ncbi:MAG: trigger factor [Kiritimatiellae bacterium]|nr:trigger factor [Kiritimatiellia bacterium]